MSTNPVSLRLPSFDLETPEGRAAAHRYVASGIVDLNQAIPELKNQIDALTVSTSSGSSSSTTTAGVTSFNEETGAVTFFPELGTADNQTGVTAYQIQQSDSGALLVLNDASAVAVDLNAAITSPFFMFAMNLGAGTVTLTPTTPSLINYYGNVGAASMPLLPGVMALIQFDGSNWNAGTIQVPVTFAAVTHQWLRSYSSLTGLFTASQPDFTDISGTATVAQLPVNVLYGSTGVVVDGGASPPSTGSKGFIIIPYNCTIIGWQLMADQSGSVQFDVKKATTISGIAATSSIVAAAPPAITAAQQNSSTTLTGWTTTLTAGNLLEFVLSSITTIQRITLELKLQKT